MTIKTVNVKHFKRGAFHEDGSPMYCITCRIEKKFEKRRRANQAVVSMIKISDTGTRLPVGYCEVHLPEEYA